MDTFLILGANSNLAECFKQIYPKNHISLDKKECDITSPQALEKAFKKYSFQYVLNCAAITDIEACQSDPLQCLTVNTTGVHFIDELCIKYNKKLVHVSSNYALFPTNIYGISKRMSEQIVCDRTLVLRTSFYHHNTYVIKELLNRRPVSAFVNLYLNPISINRIAEEIFHRKDNSGIVNIFTTEKISWYDFAQAFCRVLNIDSSLVKKATFQNREDLAQRPHDSFVKPDVIFEIEDDLRSFRKFMRIV